jgi:redox-sensing transcriptional repressor
VLPEYDVGIAILACRPEGLQVLVDRLATAGVRTLLNFVPKRVTPPEGVSVEYIDIAAKLEKLSFLARRSAAEMAP